MTLFYTKKVDTSADPVEIFLEDQEAVHASKVLRIAKGGRITATDGQGTIYEGRVTTIAGNLLRVAVTGKTEHPKPAPDVAIAIGNIKKRDRLEFAVEKAVELGVSRILIYQAWRSEKKRVRMDRLEAIALGAMKQSLRPWLPIVKETKDLGKLLDENRNRRIVVADEKKEGSAQEWSELKRVKNLLFVVGPEGGFTDQEIELLQENGSGSISLGHYRLRTETAAVAIASLVLTG